MGRKLNYKLVHERLASFHHSIWSITDFSRLFSVAKIAAQKFLAKYSKAGDLLKLIRFYQRRMGYAVAD